MKRILLILCCIGVFFAFTFSVSAEERASYVLDGKWYFNETLTPFPEEYLEDGEWWEEDVAFTNEYTDSENLICILYEDFGSISIMYGYINEEGQRDYEYVYEDGWYDYRAKYIVFDNAIVNHQFYEWFIANANKYPTEEPEPEPPVQTECDGTSCLIKDNNLDHICDTCGLPVTMALRPSTSGGVTMNGISYPLIYSVGGEERKLSDLYERVTAEYPDSRFMLFHLGDRIVLKVFYYDVVATRINGELVLINNSEVDLPTDEFELVLEDEYWAYKGRYTIEPQETFSYTQISYTSNTIYTDAGEPWMYGSNFITPSPIMAEQMMGLAGAVMKEETLPTILGSMRTMVVLGVSLIALLVVLKLFGKRFLLSLQK